MFGFISKICTRYWLLSWLIAANAVQADDQNMNQSFDIMWVAIGAILVFFMQAGFSLLESGMSRAKNAVNVMMKNYVDVCLGSLVFWFVGFGLMFGANSTGWFGSSHFFMSHGSAWEMTILLFQIMFAATAVTICSGAMAERTRYDAYLVAVCVITAFIYPVFGSWAWGGLFGGSGWLADLGFIDFAGSTVVHSVGAWCALAGIIVLGPRTGRFDRRTGQARTISGHNLSLVALGGFILWLGWFGFNGASTLKVSEDIGRIILNTQLAASAGVCGTLFYNRLTGRPILLTTTVNGSIAGLVGITAGAATMAPQYAAVTGFVAGIISVWGCYFFERIQLDDVVSAIPVHGFAGVWGTMAAGMFVQDDLFNLYQIAVQFIGVVSALCWAFPTALVMFYVIHKCFGLRASLYDEQQGLDYTEHAEVGYPEFHQNVTYNKEGK